MCVCLSFQFFYFNFVFVEIQLNKISFENIINIYVFFNFSRMNGDMNMDDNEYENDKIIMKRVKKHIKLE